MMKALSLWQPWASVVVVGSKRMETRPWATKYRGPLLIHAASRPIRDPEYFEGDWGWREALIPCVDAWTGDVFPRLKSLPYGAIIGQVTLVDCIPTENINDELIDTERTYSDGVQPGDPRVFYERMLGNFRPGRFAWIFENPLAAKPILKCKGRQRLFNVDV